MNVVMFNDENIFSQNLLKQSLNDIFIKKNPSGLAFCTLSARILISLDLVVLFPNSNSTYIMHSYVYTFTY